MRSLVLILGLIAPSLGFPACADFWAVATVKSHHFDNDTKDYEQSNWGLGFECGLSPTTRYAAGFYRNSQRIDSTYMLYVWLPLQYGPFKFGAAAGLVTGYEVEPTLGLIPALVIEKGRWGANLTYIPERKDDRGGKHVAVAGLQLKWLWK